MLMTDEVTKLRIDNKRLVELLVASRRRCANIKRTALETFDDLAEQVGWTEEPASLELVEQARDELTADLGEIDEEEVFG